MQSIENSIRQQLDVNKSRNLLFEDVKQIMDIEPGFLAALEELLDSNMDGKSEDIYAEMVSYTANELVKRLHSINPYLEVNSQQTKRLEGIYRQTWRTIIKTGHIKTALSEFHYPALSNWLAALYPAEFRQALKLSPVIGHVVYGEYSAELQMELLRIDVSHIKQPVLDIGCGGQANLARYFRSLGIEAYGIDRQLEISEPYLERTDWFEYEFIPGKWGTIISNMSFTNHLNYAYLHDISQLEHYLVKMKEVVESLSTGGSFYYAPSVPFVEENLSIKKYRIEREQKVGDIFASIVCRTA